MSKPSRRAFLTGLGGVVLATPLLESVGQATEAAAHPLVVVRTSNGVAQLDPDTGDPERFWPRTHGPISEASLSGTDADRAVSELAHHAHRLLLVSGTAYPVRTGGHCQHSGGGVQTLTAAAIGPTLEPVEALGESADSFIARQYSDNGGEPLTLFTGQRREGVQQEELSWRGPSQIRAAEDDPYNAAVRLFGATDDDPLLGVRRLSVHDLVRDQLTALLASPVLSTSDRTRLELHFDSIRDLEVNTCAVSDTLTEAMADAVGQGNLDDFRIRIAELHCDLIVTALACGSVRAATLQIGDVADDVAYVIDGVRLPAFHSISHRFESYAFADPAYQTALDQHHAIDRLHLGVFARLLDGLQTHGLADSSVAVFVSGIATGSHRRTEIPWVIAGAGDGSLAQGQFVDGGAVTHDRLLNTLITATGMRDDAGGPVVDFGDDALEGGLLDVMLAV